MSDVRIVKRELVVRLTTAKGSVLYEPVEPDTRLQDIADAWDYDYPRLVSLLDALTEENRPPEPICSCELDISLCVLHWKNDPALTEEERSQ